jgi:deoxyribodipyrimidine photo-lyase
MLASITAVRAVMERVVKQLSLQRDADAFIEEIVVRKELSDNFCLYSKDYTSLAAAPEWAKVTLHKHANDPREYIYSKKQFEEAQTHDPAWNAAQNELRNTGKMHGYMRMYWAKKVLEWSATPKEALQTLIYLNDFYSIDGGDPNGYVGILWSVAGVHDRPWGERPIYGTVRSMVYNGLKRKFSITEYEREWV